MTSTVLAGHLTGLRHSSSPPLSLNRWIVRLASSSSRFSRLILFVILLVTGCHTCQLIQQTSGGGDLLYSDIPKRIMILHGQDPYSVQPWSAPYPALLLLSIAGIIQDLV